VYAEQRTRKLVIAPIAPVHNPAAVAVETAAPPPAGVNTNGTHVNPSIDASNVSVPENAEMTT
jgi:hypothetical protein